MTTPPNPDALARLRELAERIDRREYSSNDLDEAAAGLLHLLDRLAALECDLLGERQNVASLKVLLESREAEWRQVLIDRLAAAEGDRKRLDYLQSTWFRHGVINHVQPESKYEIFHADVEVPDGVDKYEHPAGVGPNLRDAVDDALRAARSAIGQPTTDGESEWGKG